MPEELLCRSSLPAQLLAHQSFQLGLALQAFSVRCSSDACKAVRRGGLADKSAFATPPARLCPKAQCLLALLQVLVLALQVLLVAVLLQVTLRKVMLQEALNLTSLGCQGKVTCCAAGAFSFWASDCGILIGVWSGLWKISWRSSCEPALSYSCLSTRLEEVDGWPLVGGQRGIGFPSWTRSPALPIEPRSYAAWQTHTYTS